MKKFLTFIVLLCHMNFSMFLPQMAEQDAFDITGRQTDDINSLTEYIDQIVLGNVDDTPEDEDNDNGQHFLLIKTVDLFCQQSFTIISATKFAPPAKRYPQYLSSTIPDTAFDVLIPPPKV